MEFKNDINIIRTSSDSKDFALLIIDLDKDLLGRYGELQAFFDQFNKVDMIKNVIVAYHNNVPVGCGAIKDFDENTFEVKRMYVKPEFRGKGIAQTILTELEVWAKQLNASACVLETGDNQQEAVRLYKKCGYRFIENYGPYFGVKNSICMKKQWS